MSKKKTCKRQEVCTPFKDGIAECALCKENQTDKKAPTHKPSKAEVMERAIDMMALTISRGSCKHCPLYGDRKYCAEWSNAKFCDSVIKAHFLRQARKELGLRDGERGEGK
jgi:hypothetical protein